MIVVRFDEPQEYHAPGQPLRRSKVFTDEEKIGMRDVVVGMSIYGPGEAATSHAHRGSETMFIVHGRGKFGSPEGVVEVGPGDVLYFRPGEEHYLENTGSQTLEFVYVYADPDDGKALTENWVPLE